MNSALLKGILVAAAASAILMAADTSYARNRDGQRYVRSAGKVATPCVKPHPSNVRAGNKIIGRDPDPFIRGEILRNFYSGWPTTPALGDACP